MPSPSSALPHSLWDDLNGEVWCRHGFGSRAPSAREPAPGLPRPNDPASPETLPSLSYEEWEWTTSAPGAHAVCHPPHGARKDFKPRGEAAFSSSGWAEGS